MGRSRSWHGGKLLLAWVLVVGIQGLACVPSATTVPTPRYTPRHAATVPPALVTPTARPSPTPTVVPATPTPTATASPTPQPTATLPPTTTPLPTTSVNPAWLQDRTIFYRDWDIFARLPWVEIWRINADGSGKSLVVRHELSPEEAQYDPKMGLATNFIMPFSLELSPDKKTLAYSMGVHRRGNYAAGQPALWLVNVDGTQRRRVFYLSDDPIETIGKELVDVRWSPDSQRLIFYLIHRRLGWGGGEIYVLNVNDGTVECTDQVGKSLAWLPDNRRILYLRGELEEKEFSYRYELCTLDLEHRPWRPTCSAVESFETWWGGYDWSPDRRWLAFSREDDGIYIRSVTDPAESRLLAKEDDRIEFVNWSPDGRMIAYTTAPHRKPFALNVVDAQDGRKLVHVEGIWSATWSSDSQAIVSLGSSAQLFGSDGAVVGADNHIRIVFVPGGEVWQVPNVEQAGAPTW